jgi:hypothetical protein
MMRSLRLASIALQAEGLRLRKLTRRNAMRLVLVVLALPFLVATFGFLEAAFWGFLSQHFGPGFAGLIIAGANLLAGGIFLVIAATSSGSQVEIEALQVRQRALEDATRQLKLAAVVEPVVRIVIDQLRRPRERR